LLHDLGSIIALLTRYHRKGKPAIKAFELLLTEDDKRLVTQLSLSCGWLSIWSAAATAM
jgi:hypothetical protein